MKRIVFILLNIIPLLLFANDSIVYNCSFGNYKIDKIKIGEVYFSTIQVDEVENSTENGFPELPVKYINLLIPKGTKPISVNVNHISSDSVINLPYKLKIAELFESEMSLINQDVDSLNARTIYDGDRIRIIQTNYFRGNCIVTIALYPMLYDTRNDIIIYNDNISFSLHYTQDLQDKNNMYFDEEDRYILSRMVDNADSVEEYAPLNVPANSRTGYSEYLIITQRILMNSFLELMDWKRKKGISIDIVAIEDILNDSNYSGDLISNIYDDAGKLRQYLYLAYQNGLKYALLAGDNIPIRFANRMINLEIDQIERKKYNIPTDLYFSDFNGNWDSNNDGFYGSELDNVDYNSEIFIGRIMPKNEREVKNWIRKVLIYEKNPGNGNGEYLTKAFFTQADEAFCNNCGDEVECYWKPNISWINSDDYTIWNEVEDDDGPIFPTGAEVLNEFNNHYGLVSFLSHGQPTNIAISTKNSNGDPKYKVTSFDNDTPQFMISEDGNGFDNMTNYCYPTIYYSMSCLTMPFDDNNTLHPDNQIPPSSRTMGDAYTCVVKGGGPAYLGNTRYGYFPSSSEMAGKFFYAASNSYFFNLGKLENYSKLHPVYSFVKFSHNILGCPETEIWTAIPQELSTVMHGYNETLQKLSLLARTQNVKVCVMSALDNGNSYYNVINMPVNTPIVLSNVPKYHTIVFTKHNFLPKIINPQSVFIQNVVWNDDRVITADKFLIGTYVTNNESYGDVVFDSQSNILLKMNECVEIFNNFEVKLGANLEIKKENNYETDCN